MILLNLIVSGLSLITLFAPGKSVSCLLSFVEVIISSENYETKIGVRKDFWGVTETVHRVDILNQTDSVDGFDGEDKLGQPMINLS